MLADPRSTQIVSRPRAGRRAIWIALLAATVAGFCLRHAAVGCFVVDADERVYLAQMELLREHAPHPESTSNFHFYPLPIARLALLTEPRSWAAPVSVDDEVRAAMADARQARTVVAWIAALAIPATFCLACRFLSMGWALFAALLYAASPLAIAFSNQARPHAALVTAVIGAVLACLLVRRRPRITSYALAGLAIGAALSVLHSGVAVIPALFAAHVLRDRARAQSANFGLGIALGIAAAVAPLAYPPGATGLAKRAAGTGTLTLSGHPIQLAHFQGGGFVNFARALFDYEPWLALLAVAGCVLLAARLRRAMSALETVKEEAVNEEAVQKKDALVVAAWCIPYWVACGAFNDAFDRFFLPLVPVVAIVAAYGCSVLARALSAGKARPRVVSFAAGVLALTPQVFAAGRLARAWSQRDTLQQCADWIRDNVPAESVRIALFHTLDLPLLRTAGSLHANAPRFFESSRPWMRYQSRISESERVHPRYDLQTVPGGEPGAAARFQSDLLASVAGWNAQYVVVELGRPLMWPSSEALVAYLRTSATRVARFSPYTDESLGAPFVFQQMPQSQGWWTGRLWRARGIGPVVEVYRLP